MIRLKGDPLIVRLKDETIRKIEHFPEDLREQIYNEIHQDLKIQFDLGRISTNWSLEMVREDFVEAFQQATESKSGPNKRLRQMLSCMIGVLSLSKDPTHPLMWSHYAAGYAGFVIGVDPDHPCFSEEQLGGSGGLVKRVVLGWKSGVHKVKYTRRRPDFSGEKYWKLSFHLTKSKYWKYEREWRVMAPLLQGEDAGSDENNFPISLFPLAPEAIECVILGFRMQKTDAERLLDVLARNDHYSHVKLYVAQTDSKKFRINLHKIDRTEIQDVRTLIPYLDE